MLLQNALHKPEEVASAIVFLASEAMPDILTELMFLLMVVEQKVTVTINTSY